MRVSRDARSGDSPDTLSWRAGTFTLESSRLISLTRRVFSATSCISRSRWDDAWDRLSSRACTSGDGPCLHPAATSSAMGSHAPRTRRRQLRVIFLNLLRGLPARTAQGCLTRTPAVLDKCYTGRLGTVRLETGAYFQHHYYRLRGEGTTADITEGLATRAGPPNYVLSRWLFLLLLGVVDCRCLGY